MQISADPSGALKYEQTDVSATAGSITIDFTNMSSLPHDVTIEGNGASGNGSDHGLDDEHDRRSRARDLHVLLLGGRPPRGGMEGTLTVK